MKPDKYPEFATVDQIIPTTSVNNVVEPPDQKEQAGFTKDEYLACNWLNWLFRKNYEWIKYFDENLSNKIFATRNNSLVLAAFDSPDNLKSCADQIILSNQDTATVINTFINSRATGSIYLCEGTYYIKSTIVIKSSFVLTGTGKNTILIRDTSSTNLIQMWSDVSNAVLKDFVIDGNKSTYSTIVNDCSIFQYSQINNNIISGVTARNNKNYGFRNVSNISNCLALDNHIGFGGDLTTSMNYSNNVARNNIIGFSSIRLLSSCFSDCVNFEAATIHFYGCQQISSCKAYGGSNSDGFNGCGQISSSLARSAKIGFYNCYGVTSNMSIYNYQFGFFSSRLMGFNRATGNLVADYDTCYADYNNTVPVSAVAAGGFNG